MKKVYQLTAAGKDELEKELEALKAQRPIVAQEVASARDQGDLMENSEYDAARTRQGELETRIAQIEDILLNATLIKRGKSSKVDVGSTVTLSTGAGKKVTYMLVGSVEADPLDGKISNESPIGQALIGRKVGDDVVIAAPAGEIGYTVVAIE